MPTPNTTLSCAASDAAIDAVLEVVLEMVDAGNCTAVCRLFWLLESVGFIAVVGGVVAVIVDTPSMDIRLLSALDVPTSSPLTMPSSSPRPPETPSTNLSFSAAESTSVKDAPPPSGKGETSVSLKPVPRLIIGVVVVVVVVVVSAVAGPTPAAPRIPN